MSPRSDFINPWKKRGLWKLIKYHFWPRITRSCGRAEQGSFGTHFASLCGYLLLVTVGDKILIQLDPWSEYVCLLLLVFVCFVFLCKKKSCSIYSGCRDKLEKKDQDSWKFTLVVLCFLPNLMIMLESGLSVCHHFSWLYCVHWSPTSDFRSTMEGSSLPPAFYLDISIDSYLQTDFLPFFSLAYWNCWFFCSMW